MKIETFIEYLKARPERQITRGAIIDHIAGYNDTWILVVKALLIKSSVKHIAKSYLLEKLNFMRKNKGNERIILDFNGMKIFRVLFYVSQYKF